MDALVGHPIVVYRLDSFAADELPDLEVERAAEQQPTAKSRKLLKPSSRPAAKPQDSTDRGTDLSGTRRTVDDEPVPLNFDGVTVQDVLPYIVDWTGKAVMPKSTMLTTIKITLFSDRPLAKHAALDLIFQAFRLNGIGVVETPDLIMLNTIINSQYFFFQYNIGLKIRTALTSAIYRKSLRLSGASRKEMTVGETTNLMAIDTQKFMDLVLYLNMVWSSPLQIFLCLYFLWGILGPSSLAGKSSLYGLGFFGI